MKFLYKLFNHALTAKDKVSLAWISDLDGMDDISAIEFSTQKINNDFKKNVFQDESNFEALFCIDEKTHSIVERITAHFINIENMSVELEVRISNIVFLYHRQLFLIYFALMENFAQIHKQSLHIFLARAIRNATQMIKWRYYNYQSAPANVWLQISQLYKIAEQQSLLNAKIQSYSDQEPVSLSTAYIHACMLGTLESTSLKCQQIELASKILLAWTAKMTIDAVYDTEQHLFYVDTASNSPAKRIRNFMPADSYRYWGFESVNSKIELCMSLIEYSISPKQPQMKEFISNKLALTTIEVLKAEWSHVDYKRQRRFEERSKNLVSANVTYGFKDICNQFKQHENMKARRGEHTNQDGKPFEERLAAHSVAKNTPNVVYMNASTTNSKIIDQSSRSLGLRVIRQVHEVNLGMMVGISTKDQKYSIKFGLIRSVRSLGSNQLHIGVELLSNLGFCVTLENTGLASGLANNNSQFSTNNNSFANTSFDNSGNFINSGFDDPENFNGLYLPKEQALSTQETLIIPKLQYNKNDIFKANLLGEDVLIRFTKSFESDANWVRVTFTTEINK
ncbi:MAG: hypothetical protein WA123_12135 [Methylotenera sp.]